MHSADLATTPGRLKSPSRLDLIINSFLGWEPTPIFSVARLVETLAPLARMLREEVRDALRAEERAVRGGADRATQPFTGVAQDWRAMLFPNATKDEFADGFAQTVVFALVLAISDGIDIGSKSLADIAQQLEAHHTLMGRALNLLTQHITGSPTGLAVEMITRALAAVHWDKLSTAGGDQLYLHLYEHFLGVYDPARRKRSGSYYTPVEVVDNMVRMTDDALKDIFSRSHGLRDPNVSIVDPALGTGTYPLSVLRHVGAAAAKQYGPGAASEAVSSAAARLYGIELQSGPFSVAELRVNSVLQSLGAAAPSGGLNLYVADTLEDPDSGGSTQLSYTMQLIAQQRRKANYMKREINVQVVIGNPPYRERAGGEGGWIENGIDPRTNATPLNAFKARDNGRAEFVLSNLYVYFWRWATWKAFESTAEPNREFGDTGIVCYITAMSYVTGTGYKGMREYLRRKSSHAWIINLTPEGKRPPARNAIFGIETPVGIGIFARTPDTDEDEPAQVRYLELHGTRLEKFAALSQLTLDAQRWRLAREDWQAPFTPAARTEWDRFPAVGDLLPWRSTGVTPNRNWVVAPDRESLEVRLRTLLNESEPETKNTLFKVTRDRTLSKVTKPLPGPGVELNTATSLAETPLIESPKMVRVTFRSFDRQWLIADNRLLDMARPPLWEARQPGQVYVVEQHSIHPRTGPGLHFSALLPDINAFNNRGGRTLPRLHPNGEPNVAPGLDQALKGRLGDTASAADLVFYLAAVAGHPAFVEQFDDELNTPGVRVPLTAEPQVWASAIALGRQVVWLSTFGDAGEHPSGFVDIRGPEGSASFPVYEKSVGHGMPATYAYDPETETLTVGDGRWANVADPVFRYVVGGVAVVESWIKYRLASPTGRESSPLDNLNAQSWPADWSIELTELLTVITQLVALEDDQSQLLADVLAGELISIDELTEAGVRWPITRKDRDPQRARGDEVTGS